ncbi:hypothetical protein BDF21DRAFT_424939, partial [Thamnidium elegans]
MLYKIRVRTKANHSVTFLVIAIVLAYLQMLLIFFHTQLHKKRDFYYEYFLYLPSEKKKKNMFRRGTRKTLFLFALNNKIGTFFFQFTKKI